MADIAREEEVIELTTRMSVVPTKEPEPEVAPLDLAGRPFQDVDDDDDEDDGDGDGDGLLSAQKRRSEKQRQRILASLYEEPKKAIHWTHSRFHSARASAHRLCCEPSPWCERACKAVCSCLFFAVSLVLLVSGIATVGDDASPVSLANPSLPLVLQLDGCVARIAAADRSDVVVLNTTPLGGLRLPNLHAFDGPSITVTDCDDSSVITCVARDDVAAGRLPTLLVQTPRGHAFDSLIVVFTGSRQSHVLGGEGLTFTTVNATGDNGVLVLKDAATSEVNARVQHGLVDLRNSTGSVATTIEVVDAPVVIETPFTTTVTVNDTDAAVTSALGNTCFSSGTGAPSTSGTVATLGTGTVQRSVTVRRTSATPSQVFAQHTPGGVVTPRRATNTLDTTAGVTTVDGSYAPLFAAALAADRGTGRTVVHGPSIPTSDVFGVVDWAWFQRDAYIWFPQPVIRTLSMYLLNPQTSRFMTTLSSGTCVQEVSFSLELDVDVCGNQVVGSDFFPADTNLTVRDQSFLVFAALSTEMTQAAFNDSQRFLRVHDQQKDTGRALLGEGWSMLQHGLFEFFQDTAATFAPREVVYNDVASSSDQAFAPVYIALITVSTTLLLFVGTKAIMAARNKYFRKWAAIDFGEDWVKNNELCRAKIGPIFFIESLVARVDPGFSAVMGLPSAFLTVLAHWLLTTVLVVCLFFLGLVFASSDARYGWCMLSDLMTDSCEGPPRVFPWFCFVLITVYYVYAALYLFAFYVEFDSSPPAIGYFFASHKSFHLCFFMIWMLVLFLTLMFGFSFLAWLVLAALIEPLRFAHVVIAFASVFYVSMGLYTRATAFVSLIRETVLSKYQGMAKRKYKVIKRETERLMADKGLSQQDIIILLVLSILLMVTLIVFILLGISSFTVEENVFSTVVKSVTVIMSTVSVGLARDPSQGAGGRLKIVGSLTKKLDKTNKVLGKVQKSDRRTARSGTAVAAPEATTTAGGEDEAKADATV